MRLQNAKEMSPCGFIVTAGVHGAIKVWAGVLLDQFTINRCIQLQAQHARLNRAGDIRSKGNMSAQERNSSGGKDKIVLRAAANKVGFSISWR